MTDNAQVSLLVTFNDGSSQVIHLPPNQAEQFMQQLPNGGVWTSVTDYVHLNLNQVRSVKPQPPPRSMRLA